MLFADVRFVGIFVRRDSKMRSLLLGPFLALGLLLVGLGFAPQARADVVTTATSATVTGLGDEISSGYDKLSFTGLSGVFTPGVPMSVGTITFNGGTGNCTVCNTTTSGSLASSMMLGTTTLPLSIGFIHQTGQSADTLTFGPIADLTFEPNHWVSFETPGVMTVSAGAPVMSESLMATEHVPEPASLALLGTGLFGLGFIVKRRPGAANDNGRRHLQAV